MRQFPDSKGKIVAKLRSCDELVLLEKGSPKPGGYVEAVFLSADAKEVKRGWIIRNDKLYIFPEARPTLPRTDTTPDVAFPWAKKAPEPGDPDFARVTKKEFLMSCLANPHPEKSRAILTQILDRYVADLTSADVIALLPHLRHSYEADLPRIRELLAKFKTETAVAEFLAGNPLFGPVVEAQEVTPAPKPTPVEIIPEKKPGIPYRLVGIGLGALALGLALLALVFRSRKKKDVVRFSDSGPTYSSGGETDTFTGNDPKIE